MSDHGLPVERRPSAIAAVKAVELRGPYHAPAVHPIGRYWRDPATPGALEIARCRRRGRRGSHPAPDLGCRCGFHACADAATLARTTAVHPDHAVAEVDVSGRVIEHDHGWRASHQQIRALWLHDRCARCGAPSSTVAAATVWCPVCDRCALAAIGRGGAVLGLHEVAALVGVPVGFASFPVETRRAWRLWRVAAGIAFVLAVACLVTVLVLSRRPAPVAGAAAAVTVAAGALVALWRLPSSREASRWFSVVCGALSAAALLVAAGATGLA